MKKWLGFGPPASMLALLRVGERALVRLVVALSLGAPRRRDSWRHFPRRPRPPPLASALRARRVAVEPGVVQLAPTTDPIGTRARRLRR